MTARVVLVGPRRDELTREECREYFEREYLPLLKEVPGLERVSSGIPMDPGRLGGHRLAGSYDVLVELRFERGADIPAAFNGPAGRRVLQDAGQFLDLEGSVLVAVGAETLQYRSIPKTI